MVQHQNKVFCDPKITWPLNKGSGNRSEKIIGSLTIQFTGQFDTPVEAPQVIPTF